MMKGGKDETMVVRIVHRAKQIQHLMTVIILLLVLRVEVYSMTISQFQCQVYGFIFPSRSSAEVGGVSSKNINNGSVWVHLLDFYWLFAICTWRLLRLAVMLACAQYYC